VIVERSLSAEVDPRATKRTTTGRDTVNRNDTTDRLPRELAYRANDGIEVWLLWTRVDNRLLVVVHDERHNAAFELHVDPATALDAFHHPFAYAAFGGVAYPSARRRGETLIPA
jgi:hypothetical protein